MLHFTFFTQRKGGVLLRLTSGVTSSKCAFCDLLFPEIKISVCLTAFTYVVFCVPYLLLLPGGC